MDQFFPREKLDVVGVGLVEKSPFDEVFGDCQLEKLVEDAVWAEVELGLCEVGAEGLPLSNVEVGGQHYVSDVG